MPGTINNGELCRHRVPPILAAESAALERDLAYLAQMQARKVVLQAQAMLLQAHDPNVDAVEAPIRGMRAEILVITARSKVPRQPAVW